MKTILTDVDGVLLDWEYSFDRWIRKHGYEPVENGFSVYNIADRYNLQEAKKMIRSFNESAWMRRLPPLRDSIKYVRKLHEENGYVFHAITSQTTDRYAQELRIENLRALFGETAFEEFTFLDTGADKDDALEEYRDSGLWWIEDKPSNAELGSSLGLRSILMLHPHNASVHGNFIKVSNWKQIYETISLA